MVLKEYEVEYRNEGGTTSSATITAESSSEAKSAAESLGYMPVLSVTLLRDVS